MTPFALLVPIFGLSSGALLLGEKFTPLELLATVVILAGLATAIWPRRRKPAAASS